MAVPPWELLSVDWLISITITTLFLQALIVLVIIMVFVTSSSILITGGILQFRDSLVLFSAVVGSIQCHSVLIVMVKESSLSFKRDLISF